MFRPGGLQGDHRPRRGDPGRRHRGLAHRRGPAHRARSPATGPGGRQPAPARRAVLVEASNDRIFLEGQAYHGIALDEFLTELGPRLAPNPTALEAYRRIQEEALPARPSPPGACSTTSTPASTPTPPSWRSTTEERAGPGIPAEPGPAGTGCRPKRHSRNLIKINRT